MRNFIILFILAAVAIHSQTNSQALLETGISDYNRGQYDFAVTNLKKYLDTTKEDSRYTPKALYYLGISFYFGNKYAQALIYMEEITARYRLSEYAMDAQFWKGLIYQNMGRWNEAEDSFSKFITLYPGSDIADRAYLAYANSQFELKKLKESLSTLKNLLDKFTKSGKYDDAAILYCYLLIKTELTDDAAAFLTKRIAEIGEDGGTNKYRDLYWLYLAEIYYEKKDFKNASSLYKKIDNFKPGTRSGDIALFRLSDIELALGNEETALEYIRRLKGEYPDSRYNIDILISQGVMEFNKKNFKTAIEMFSGAASLSISKTGDNEQERTRTAMLKSKALLYLAESYYANGEIPSHSRTLREIIENNLSYKSEAVVRLFETSIERKDTELTEKIIKNYESVLRSDNVIYDRYLVLLGEYLNRLGKYTDAVVRIGSITDKVKYKENINRITLNSLLGQKKYDESLIFLRDTLKTQSADQKAYTAYELMGIYFNSGNFAETIKNYELFNIYIKDAPSKDRRFLTIKSSYIAAISYMQIKNYKEAQNSADKLSIYRLDKGLSADEKNLINMSNYYSGWIKYKTSDYTGAANSFKEAFNVVTDSDMKLDALYMEGWSYYTTAQYKEAIARFERLAELSQSPAKAFFNIAVSYNNIKENKKALSYYQKVFELKDNNEYRDDALYEIIKYFIGVGDIKNANEHITVFEGMFKDTQLYPGVLQQQAEYFLSIESYSEAYAAYKNLLKTSQDKSKELTVRYWTGYCAYKTDNLSEAVNYLSIFRETDSPFKEQALTTLRDIYKVQNNLKQEKEIISELLSIGKTDADYNKKRLAVINKILSGADSREAELKTAAEESGSHDDQLKLAFYYMDSGKTDTAIGLLSQIRQTNKNGAGTKANNRIALFNVDQEKFDEAIAIYRESITAFKGEPSDIAEALYYSAYCYYKIGQSDNAVKFIKTIQSKYKSTDWTEKAASLLDIVTKDQ